MVVQVARSRRSEFMDILRQTGLSAHAIEVACQNPRDQIEIYRDAKPIFQASRAKLQRVWSRISTEISRRRDNPEAAEQQEAASRTSLNPMVVVMPAGLSRQIESPPHPPW